MDMPFLKLAVSYFLLLSILNVASSGVEMPSYYNHSCTINNTFPSNSSYLLNLDDLLYLLHLNAMTTDAKFYNTSSDSDSVYGEYMCRGDVPLELCQNCVEDAINRIISECANNTEAIIWYDQCSVRYSDRRFFSNLTPEPIYNDFLPPPRPRPSDPKENNTPSAMSHIVASAGQCCIPSVSDDEYIGINRTLYSAVAEAAVATNKFATKEVNLTSDGNLVYSLVQCTPDLSQKLCSKCLHGLINLITLRVAVLYGGRILNPSCNLRVASYQFYYKGNQRPSVFTSIINEGIEGPAHLKNFTCGCPENFTAKYLNNLKSLILKLNESSNSTTNNGFYDTMVGSNKSDDTNNIYGLFMCRGDVSVKLCNECVSDGLLQLNTSCPSSKEAIIWYDVCMLRYSNRSFFSSIDTQPTYVEPGFDLIQKQTISVSNLVSSLHELVEETTKSVQGVTNFGSITKPRFLDFTTLYALAQCTPNLNIPDCKKCLQSALGNITNSCFGKNGGQAMNPSCNMRFETYRFFGNKSDHVLKPPASPRTPKVLENTEKHDHGLRTIMIAVSASIVLIVLFCFGYYFWRLRKKRKSYKNILKNDFGSEGATLELLQFDWATIEAATDKFSIENKIGKGGFGEVYMGILSNDRKIAVKRLSKNSHQGLLEFKNEVLLIAKLQHRNLVALLGFCLKDQEKILVYEYVPNKSLDYFLFGSQRPRVLNWPERYKIIEGIARGIQYLHEHSRHKVIHRDLKPGNILLDDEMNPKISDFGMARMVGINEDMRSTNRIVGTMLGGIGGMKN